MKINPRLLEHLKQKNINADVFLEKMPDGSNDSKDQSNESSSYLDKTASNLNFRVRPISAVKDSNKGELDMMSTATSNFYQNQEAAIQQKQCGEQKLVNNSNANFRKSKTQFYNTSDNNSNISNMLNNPSTIMTQSVISNSKLVDAMKNRSDEIISEEITSEFLENRYGIDPSQFEHIQKLVIQYNCDANSLQSLGEFLPNLVYIKLSKSIIRNLRYIGTSLQNLKIIYISKSQLQDLSGIIAFPHLQEFYASYNMISDLRPLYYNETIEILDLEGNEITDIENIQVLESIVQLKELNLINNPIQKNEKYIIKLEQLKNLQILDDQPLELGLEKSIMQSQLLQNKSQKQNKQQVFDDIYLKFENLKIGDEEIVPLDLKLQIEKELQQEPDESDILMYSIKKKHCKVEQQLAQKAGGMSTNPNSTHQQQDNKINNKKSDVSSLVENSDVVFYGNPLKAIRDQRKKIFISDDDKSSSVPKDILDLLDTFKIEDEYAALQLEEELLQIELQATQINTNAPASNSAQKFIKKPPVLINYQKQQSPDPQRKMEQLQTQLNQKLQIQQQVQQQMEQQQQSQPILQAQTLSSHHPTQTTTGSFGGILLRKSSKKPIQKLANNGNINNNTINNNVQQQL